MKRSSITAALVAATVLATVAAAQQQTRRTETGTVTADDIVYDFANNDFKATGNVSVQIEGRHNAKMRAPALSMDLSDSLNRILKLVASGPVHFEVLTAADSKGLRRKIIASCSQRATYDADSETVVLSGDALADVTTLPEGNVEAAHFTGESITVDLHNSTLSVKQAQITVTAEVAGQGDGQ